MSSSRSELEGRIRDHFQDKAAGSVEAMLSDGIDRVNEDIEASLDPNRKERLEATREKLLEWQAQLARKPLLSSTITSEEKASAGGRDDINNSNTNNRNTNNSNTNTKNNSSSSSSSSSSFSCSSSNSSSSYSCSSSNCSSSSSSFSVTVSNDRPLVSSSFNENVVLSRRPDDKDGAMSIVIGGLCINSNEKIGGVGELLEEGVLACNSSTLFVCDSYNNRVVAVDATSDTLIRTVYGDGSIGSGPNQLYHPYGICLLALNNSDERFLFIADRDNHRVQMVICGTGTLVGSIGGNGEGAGNDKFNCPTGVAIGPSTSNTCFDPLLFVTDCSNHRVQVFNAKTLAYVRTIGGYNGKGPGQFGYPNGICIGDVLSSSNNTGTSSYSTEYSIFVADSYYHRILVFNAASGSFLRTIGSGVSGDRPGQLFGPQSVYYLPAGAGSSHPNGDPHIYVTDCHNRRVAIFNANSGAHVRHIDVGFQPNVLVPVTTSDGDSFIYVGTYHDSLKIVHECNYARVIQLLYLMNHQIFDGFILNLDYELRDKLVESLTLEML